MSPPMHPGRLIFLRVTVIVLLAAPLTLAVPALLRGEDEVPDEPTPSRAERAPLSESRPVMGFAIVAHHISDLPRYLSSVDRIVELGANTLVVVTPFFQRRVDSSSVRRLPDRCPTDEQLVAILRHARQRGLRTTLQPIVLIEKPEDKDWRGLIRPRDWDSWWASYHRFIEYFVDIAVEARVDAFTVGSELNTTEDAHHRWREVVRRVRKRFTGELTYSANWDRYDKVRLWPLVDYASVSSYFELQRDDHDAPEAALIQDWIAHRDRLLDFADSWDMPLMLSEVGYPSLPWAGAHPWNYVAPKGTKADHETQARCYRAFFTAWGDRFLDPAGPAVGFFCYHWDPYHQGQEDDTGYGIDGKPAYDVIREAFDRLRAGTATDRKPQIETPDPSPPASRPDG